MSESTPRWIGGYRLQENLGAGGSGTVWRAADPEGNAVALKLLHPALASTEKSRKRLAREARLVNRIEGSGVAQVLDFEADDTFPFVVTELIEGPTLAEVIAEAPLDFQEAHLLSAQLDDILRRVHRAGIVHRDLKPSNIILSETGPVLIDFGIAQTQEDQRLTKTGLMCGTPGFVSPELLGATDPDHQLWIEGDWWALSALLLSSLTGRRPFAGSEPAVILSNITRGVPDVDGLPENMARTFVEALAPDPQRRLPAEILLQRLAAASSDLEPELSVTTVFDRRDHQATAQLETFDTVGVTELVPLQEAASPVDPVSPVNPASPVNPVNAATFSPEFVQLVPQPPLPPPPPANTAVNVSFIAFLAFFPAMALLQRWWAPGVTAGIIVLLASLGSGSNWLERRRYRKGGVSRSDAAWTWMLAPRHLLLGALSSLPAMALTAAVVVAGYFGLPHLGREDSVVILWIAVFLSMLIGYYLPASHSWRVGSRLVARGIAPTWVGQLVVTVIILTILALLLSLV